MEKILFLPVEISTRELDSKLLIAIEATRKGFTVVLGSVQVLLMAELMKCGVVFYKDASAPMENRFKKLKKNGAQIVVHDEEGFVHLDDNIYLNARLRFKTIEYVDLFFAWGRHQAHMVEQVVREFKSKSKVIITGHPRIDFLRTPFVHNGLPNNDEKVILINTKLAEYNHRLGPDGWISILDSHSMIHNDKDRALRLEQKEYKKALFFEYQELISTLSKEFPDYRIVIRPHPVENKQVWLDFSSAFQNVEVVWDGSISEWINRSEVVIHTGCTTGLEAAIMNKPVISYKPITNPKFDIKLPDSVSKIAYSTSQLISYIKTGGDDKKYAEVMEILAPHLYNLQGKFSYEDIVTHIAGLKPVKLKATLILLPLLKVLFLCRDFLKKAIKDRRGLEKKDPKFKTSIEEIKAKNNLLQKLMGVETSNIIVKKFSDEIYILRKSD